MRASPPTGAPNTRGSNFRPIFGYNISETVRDRGIVTMEDEYKVVCALSNGAVFDYLEWPRTPVSRSHYSLNTNISIHSIFGSRLGFSGSADRMALFAVRQNPRWRLKDILEQPPSWNDGTRVTLASAGLSSLYYLCCNWFCELSRI